MKVLWFEVNTPSRYFEDGRVTNGWQDSLEALVHDNTDIDLHIVFETLSSCPDKCIDGIHYYPIYANNSFVERLANRWTCERNIKKLIDNSIQLIEKIRPDIIHVFGTEWLWGLVAEQTSVPVVIHIQGALQPYYNALYPPRYNNSFYIKSALPNIKKIINGILDRHRFQTSYLVEKRVWKCVNNYMGRTEWDHSLLKSLNPSARYFHVEEALRKQFLSNSINWHGYNNNKLSILTTGCGTFWKGPDMLLKTANVLKNIGIDFKWDVIGGYDNDFIRGIEKKECICFKDVNVTFHGPLNASAVSEMLAETTLYVHTAYIENSPNSICEAQIMGVPIVSTNVGGISTLIGDYGELVPANDPWQMASAIIELFNNKERMKNYSLKGREKALVRHNPNNIVKQLLNCYSSIITNARS